MAELPEIAILARQLDERLSGKTLAQIVVLQPKCLNLPAEAFCAALADAHVQAVTQRGKWLFVETSRGWLLLNLGMGGEILLIEAGDLPKKHRLVFEFTDTTRLSVNFWWFGYAHYVPPGGLAGHKPTAALGPNALDVSVDALGELLLGRRGRIKDFLLDQTRLAGIGNFYVHDILFTARLHPLRRIATLGPTEVAGLHRAIHAVLETSLAKGGFFYEVDTYGHNGGYRMEDVLVGYKEGKPCPACGAVIEKIRTGSTAGFICPACQPA